LFISSKNDTIILVYYSMRGITMNLEIKKLTPHLIEDYLNFFDTTTHSTGKDEHKCYCVCWASADHTKDVDFSTAEERRELARRYIDEGIIQGYLAYSEDKTIGWCNANTKSDCLQCISWLKFMGDVSAGENESGVQVKSVF
jgi:hypothetical protein